jgi:pyrimidine deaminase RibD-like protein
MPFLDGDRRFLMQAFKLAEEAARPPSRLGQRPEPAWAALVANGEKVISSAAFSPGDREDAVRKLLAGLNGPVPAGTSLYLTLEPKAGFDRLPPVTESVRRLGVGRVVIGTLDPAQRYRGEGSRTLQQGGVEVVLADGEEARFCQYLIEDYSKWLSRGLAVLRAQVELAAEADGSFDLKFQPEAHALRTDAFICRAGEKYEPGEAWRVVLDPKGSERPGEKRLIYQVKPAAGARPLPMRDGAPDLGALLRELGSLGFLSAELSADPELFRLAVRSGLLDSVMARFAQQHDGIRALSHLGRVHLREGGDPLDLKLNGARLVGERLEARVELC